MVSIRASPSTASLSASTTRNSIAQPPPSPPPASSASSSRVSLDQADQENVTVTVTRTLSKSGKQKSQEDLRLLAISTHMTELSYTISDIQTRIFEIQELRHKSQSSGDTAGTTTIIDQSLMSLDEKLESVAKGMKAVSDSLEPLLQNAATPTLAQNGDGNENTMILRKHASLVAEWEAVQDESETLREELKEDKWLTVFRTVTDQADGMMSSLEKGVNRCQEFIWQVHKRNAEDSVAQSQVSLISSRSDKPPSYELFLSLFESFEAKKKHYMPATSKVLSIIDKGVRDRVTKNGETLRRHAESAQRWKNLKERIARTDAEMEVVRKILLVDNFSENGSSTSATTSAGNGYLATPSPSSRMSRAPSAASTISRSISPFRKLARKITGATKSPPTPVTPLSVKKNSLSRAPSSAPPSSQSSTHKQRMSIFGSLRGSQPPTPSTPDRPVHKYSQSLTPDSTPSRSSKGDGTVKSRPSGSGPVRPPWNSSTKVDDKQQTVKATPPKRAPSAAGMHGDSSSGPSGISPYRRSLSRTSIASSRPWSPLTSSISTNNSTSHYPPMPSFRPPSRAQTPSRSQTPARAPSRAMTPGLTPRPRPKTPSHIPMPSNKVRSVSGAQSELGDDDSRRTTSPALSSANVSPTSSYPPRPPSRSMIPLPTVYLSSSSRPATSMSSYARSESPSLAFRASAARAQTPESALRNRVQQLPLYHGSVSGRPSGGRPSLMNKVPPSSFKDGAGTVRTPSRTSSRASVYTPTTDNLPLHEYIPGNLKDPLDVEVSLVANSLAHGLLVERVDPPLKKVPADGEEIKGQYAFSNALSRKVVTCRLTTLTRTGRGGKDVTTKKVMCRVGGGWQDLSHYILNRQAGM